MQTAILHDELRRGRDGLAEASPAASKPSTVKAALADPSGADPSASPAPPARLAPGKSEARLLAALARECALAGIGRCVLLLRLSGLPPQLRRPHHVRLARAALEPLAQADRARLFLLKGDDLALVWRGDSEALLLDATTTLDRLFEDAAAPPWLLFRLPQHADALIATLRPPPPQPPPDPTRRPPGKLDIRGLAALESGLARVDVAQFMRRSRVCALDADGMTYRPRWEQRFLAIADLADTIAPDRAVQADPWLFRRLTRTLDQRLLSLLSAPRELDDAGAFSLTLNVASILSPSFLRFDAALPAVLRGHVILELAPPDVLGDLPAFLFARDFVRERGYRLLLRDLDAALLPVFPPGRMGVDFMKLQWSEAMAAQTELAPQDAARCVLTHADAPPAIRWGQAKGIGLYQGRMTDPA